MGLPVAGTLSRRSFARGMIAALVGSRAVTLPWMARAASPAKFDALIRHRAGAERIGRRYLAMLPAAHANRSHLMTPMLERALHAMPHEPGLAAALLRQGIESDFRCAHTVMVDGWVLAATEARLCAVVALG